MCATCGCGGAGVRVSHAGHGHPHGHDRTVTLEVDLLAANDALARRNRGRLDRAGIVAVNLMSSPGSGKTTLLERTIRTLGGVSCAVLEGDQETLLDADRIAATGARAVQINTGAGCHLDAGMVARGLDALAPEDGSLVFVENVGNLVCPALFALGEHARVVIMSVTEGADKPLKYPHMFRTADLVVLTKTDLLPHVDFAVHDWADAVRRARPGVAILQVSATTGAGMDEWRAWLEGLRTHHGAPTRTG
ncbi:hydrogenase nickel incorporation protein HypB [Pseudonocardia pini]|uniref:hydrogenase nickel incorporation protein HypB n=1 Tax=Pseudonocardia pini TaxID=2758030 RepID=UPI0015F0A7B2|nr:hydrogenase nickel incorporation protein HypB [Pseudonocardia pini]